MYQEQRQLKKGKMGEEMLIFSSNESANGFKTPQPVSRYLPSQG